MASRGRNKVVLYSSHCVAEQNWENAYYRAMPPVSHMALAGPVKAAGYDVRLVDPRWDRDWKLEVKASIDQVACVGITSLTGPSVTDGLQFASFVRGLRPDVPIVWGGWHATFAARMAVEDPHVDAVVRGFGESTFVELLAAYESGSSLREIRGLTFKDGDEVIQTPDRPAEDINQFPHPAWDLIDPDRYIYRKRPGVRQAATVFSRGCPYDCEFCLDSRNKWLGLSVERMLEEIEFWVGRGANRIMFLDGNFFLGKKRIVEFCEALLARGLEKKFKWSATAVGHRIVQMDEPLLELLARAGLHSMAIGAESGSQELISRITNKTTVEHSIEAFRRLTRHGIGQFIFLMVGYPDEPADALDRTLRLAHLAKRINPNAEIQINFTTPLPGSDVFRYAVEKRLIEEPRVFADWARFDYLHANVLNLPEGYAKRVRQFARDLSIAYPAYPVANPGPTEWVKKPVRSVLRWQLGRKYSRPPVDLPVASGPGSGREDRAHEDGGHTVQGSR